MELANRLWEALSQFMRPFVWDSRNPCRRYCVRCGQKQEMYESLQTEFHWWEPIGIIRDAKCRCHKWVPREFRPTEDDQCVPGGLTVSEIPRFVHKRGWYAVIDGEPTHLFGKVGENTPDWFSSACDLVREIKEQKLRRKDHD